MGKNTKGVGGVQAALFNVPVEVLWVDPVGLGTADAGCVCRCVDGCDYVIKDGAKNALIPHSEWFCSSLAEAVGLACPSFKIIKQLDNSLVFGSRWEGGILEEWWKKALNGDISLYEYRPILSRIFAFDHFVHNVDRHLKNYLFREQREGWAVLALDYSRAWLCHGFPLPELPFEPKQNTRKAQRRLKEIFGNVIVPDEADELLNRIRSVTK